MPGESTSSRAAHAKPWVLVRAGQARLAIHSDWVRELLALPAVTRLPGLAGDALGLITWRGRAVPAIDLAARVGLGWGGSGEEGTAAGRRMAVVVADGARHVAFAVDAVDGVELLAADSIAPLPEGLEARGDVVREHGRTRRDGALVLLLDVRALLGTADRPDEGVDAADFWGGQAPAPDAPSLPAETASQAAPAETAIVPPARKRSRPRAAGATVPPASPTAPPASPSPGPRRGRTRT